MRSLVGSSWKMNLTSSDARSYLARLLPLVREVADRDLFVLPSFPVIWAAREALRGSGIAWGAQDVHAKDSGPHTGDVSAPMLADLGCRYVEVGHAERRIAYHETGAAIAAKVAAVLRWEMVPIVCVGERTNVGSTRAVSAVLRQLSQGLSACRAGSSRRLVIAYEPAWAIGGSQAADIDHVISMAGVIRGWLARSGPSVDEVHIVYGGSVDHHNASEFLDAEGLDGLFVGRAALDPVEFAALANLRLGRSRFREVG